MNIVSINETNVVKKALQCLQSGGILIYPTETAYGVGVDATNAEAVTKVLEYKKRPQGKAISVGVSSKEMAKQYVEITAEAENIYNQFLPGPITLVSKSKHTIDKRLEAENATLGIRYPDYPLLLKIITEFGKPITTTSANSSGKKTPYSVQDILENLSEKQKEKIHTIIDAGELPKNPPSTVIDVSSVNLKIYRQGAISVFKNQTVIQKTSTNNDQETIRFAENFIQNHQGERNVFLLNGVLGAGKTQFVKGIALGLGINQTVTSPTYTYMQEYTFKTGKLIHIDAWRIDNNQDLELLLEENVFVKENIITIEWPGVILDLNKSILAGKAIWVVNISQKGDNLREIIISQATL